MTNIHYHNCCGCQDGWCKTKNPDGSITECVPDVTLAETETELDEWKELATKYRQFLDLFALKDHLFSCALEPKGRMILARDIQEALTKLREHHEALTYRTIVTEEESK